MATRRRAEKPIHLAQGLFRAMTGRKDAELLPAPPRAPELLEAVGGGDLKAAAKELGVPVAQARKWASGEAKPQQRTLARLEAAATAKGWAAPEPSLRGMLITTFGGGKDGSEIDRKAAAKALGVTPATIRKWENGEVRRPRKANKEKLISLTRKTSETAKGRREAAAEKRAQVGRKRSPLNVTVDAHQGVVKGGINYSRRRSCTPTRDMDPAEADDFMDAYENGGQASAMNWVSGYFNDEYADGWTIDNDQVYGFRFD